MQTPLVSGIYRAGERGASTQTNVRTGAHECFRGVHWLLGILVLSLGLWVTLGWGVHAVVSAL
jgi:hypothetical protein